MNNFVRELNQLIQSWSLSKKVLAERIHIDEVIFSNKCDENNQDQFTGIQLNQLADALKMLQNDLDHCVNSRNIQNNSLLPEQEPRQWFTGKKKHK